MSSSLDRLVFGRVVGERVVGWRGSGRAAVFPLSRRERLVVSRADCDVVILHLPRAAARRLPSRIAVDLPRSFPGLLPDYLSDCLLQRHRHGWVAAVVLMKPKTLALYEDAAGAAPLTLLSFLLRRDRRAPGPVRLGVARGPRAERRPLERQLLFTDGSTSELATYRNETLTSSVLLLDPRPTADRTTSSTRRRISLPPYEKGAPRATAECLLPRHRFSCSFRLFDEQRGVDRWMRSPFLSSLFLSIAIPLLLSASFAAASLRTRRSEELHLLAARAERELPDRMRSASSPSGTKRPTDGLPGGSGFGPVEIKSRQRTDRAPPDAYSILCTLLRSVDGNATVRSLSLSRGTLTLELRARDPLAVLQNVESAASVAEAELESAGARADDGRMPATLRVVYR